MKVKHLIYKTFIAEPGPFDAKSQGARSISLAIENPASEFLAQPR